MSAPHPPSHLHDRRRSRSKKFRAFAGRNAQCYSVDRQFRLLFRLLYVEPPPKHRPGYAHPVLPSNPTSRTRHRRTCCSHPRPLDEGFPNLITGNNAILPGARPPEPTTQTRHARALAQIPENHSSDLRQIDPTQYLPVEAAKN